MRKEMFSCALLQMESSFVEAIGTYLRSVPTLARLRFTIIKHLSIVGMNSKKNMVKRPLKSMAFKSRARMILLC